MVDNVREHSNSMTIACSWMDKVEELNSGNTTLGFLEANLLTTIGLSTFAVLGATYHLLLLVSDLGEILCKSLATVITFGNEQYLEEAGASIQRDAKRVMQFVSGCPVFVLGFFSPEHACKFAKGTLGYEKAADEKPIESYKIVAANALATLESVRSNAQNETDKAVKIAVDRVRKLADDEKNESANKLGQIQKAFNDLVEKNKHAETDLKKAKETMDNQQKQFLILNANYGTQIVRNTSLTEENKRLAEDNQRLTTALKGLENKVKKSNRLSDGVKALVSNALVEHNKLTSPAVDPSKSVTLTPKQTQQQPQQQAPQQKQKTPEIKPQSGTSATPKPTVITPPPSQQKQQTPDIKPQSGAPITPNPKTSTPLQSSAGASDGKKSLPEPQDPKQHLALPPPPSK